MRSPSSPRMLRKRTDSPLLLVDSCAPAVAASGTVRPDLRPPSPPPRYRAKLRTLADIRHELTRLYRQMRSGTVPVADGGRLAYVLAMLAKLDSEVGFEQRLQALEDAQKRQ